MSTPQRVRHPLDPLTADEFRLVASVLRRERGVGRGWRHGMIELAEPDKAAVLAFDAARSDEAIGPDGPGLAGSPMLRPGRAARAVCWNTADGAAYRALVSLDSGIVLAWEHLPGIQPNLTIDEWHECDQMLHAHSRLAEALARRGITDLSRVVTDVWAYDPAVVPERYRGLRLGWSDIWYRASVAGSPYAHHLSGLHPVVDLNQMTLLELEDSAPAERPEVAGEYLPALTGLPPRASAPLHVSQPEGPSFTLDGCQLTWQNWRMRLGFGCREGLVLHTVGYLDTGRLRPVAHRMSFAEMVVPYRDATADHYRRTAFDIGEWGLGFMTTSLELGCDCLGEIAYLDAVVHDSAGQPQTIRNAICIHEEDSGVLWKHVDDEFGPEVRRARRLVVSFHATVANYEYLIYWRFYQDGSIECEVLATGIMVTSYFAAGRQPATGTLVDERTYAPFHQHFIVARLDLDIDGRDNTVYATRSEALPVSQDNPQGLRLVSVSVPLRTEAEGRQDYDWQTQLGWTIANDNVSNGLGTPVGYRLIPSGSFPALIDPASPLWRRAGAIGHVLWVTPYRPDERWPCGEFPTLSADAAGLTAWTGQNRPIENADLVLWHVFGLHHITRPEDWPVMPCDSTSFWLKPFGFFGRNPALDVPPEPAGHG